jgi:hypothetical protein
MVAAANELEIQVLRVAATRQSAAFQEKSSFLPKAATF